MAGRESEPYDLLIIGAGPAGAACALRAAQLGARPLLVDRRHFPRWKVCGCCLNRAGVAVLERLGVEEIVAAPGASVPLSWWEGRDGRVRVRQPLRGGCAVAREHLDRALVETAGAAGAEFCGGTKARIVAVGAGAVSVELSGAASSGRVVVTARVVVVASGLLDPAAQRWLPWTARPHGPIGAGVTLECDGGYEPGVIHMACGRGGYVGAVRLADGRLDLAAALSGVRGRGQLAERMAAILSGCSLPVPPGLATARVHGTPPLTRRRTPAAHRLLAIGDALSYVEPFTGEGMAWALGAGEAVAPLAVAGAGGWTADIEVEWRRTVAARARRQWPCRLLGAGLRHPRLRHGLLSVLARAPWLGHPLVRQLDAA